LIAPNAIKKVQNLHKRTHNDAEIPLRFSERNRLLEREGGGSGETKTEALKED
jgi:hypothetical protein